MNPDLLKTIQTQLEAPRENLSALFCETLLWGRAQTAAFQREMAVAAGQTVSLGFTPVAQVSGLPVLRVDWPFARLPGVTQRRAVYHSLKSTYVEHVLVYLTEDGKQAAFVWARTKGQGRVEMRTLPYASGCPARTTVEQLGKLAFSLEELGLFGDPGRSLVTDKLDAAFDVEAVTKEFFKSYRRIFEEAEASITLDWSTEQKRLYTQRFFNRLMFLTFVERKGWLVFGGRRDYLRALFADYQRSEEYKRREANFHRTRLNTLFFLALANRYEADQLQDPQFQVFRALVGEVPYLNGGLFEKEDDDETWFFPDLVVAKILTELVYAFNFTVTESTPLDVEVAVDPEMLGMIFEELVTGRHETGSYYTPKPVVAFMCREALKGYLETALPHETPEAVARFVDGNEGGALRDPETALGALKRIKVCDPACGSGAYLLGMLHELLEQRACLFAARQLDPKTVYERKLEIIQNSLYGVDIDPFAVNIARLRLWLSLIVDFEGETPPPLPNLTYKIETGDSLTAPDPSGGLEIGFRRQLIDSFLQAKQEYLTAHHERKLFLRKEIDTMRDEIVNWSGRASTSGGFDWLVEFAEVFVAPTATTTFTGAMAGMVNAAGGQMELTSVPPNEVGFHVVLANPPYVRADAQFKHIENETERQQAITEWKASREKLKRSKVYATLHEKWDLYIPFLERAHQLLHPQGQMVFIIPDAYNAAKYAEKSHDFFLQNSRIKRIDFCSEIDLFDAGVNNTILHFEKGAPPASHRPVRARRWGKRDEFEDNQENLPTLPQSEFGETLFRFNGTKNEISEGFVTLDMVCYVSVGMAIHADEKKAQGLFKADDLVSEVKDRQHPKSYVEGKDIARWGFQRTRYLEYGTERAPSMFRRPTFIELHEPPEKLMAFRMCGENIAVAYDNRQYMSNHTVILCVPWHFLKNVTNKSIKKTAEYIHQNPEGNREHREELSQEYHLKYVLAVMNSTFAKEFLKKNRQSKIDIYPDEWKQLPIAPLPLEAQQPFIEKVDAILGEYARHGYPLPPESAQKVKELERELDEMVGRLYEAGGAQ